MRYSKYPHPVKVRLSPHTRLRLREVSGVFEVKETTILRNAIEEYINAIYDEEGNIKEEILERCRRIAARDM